MVGAGTQGPVAGAWGAGGRQVTDQALPFLKVLLTEPAVGSAAESSDVGDAAPWQWVPRRGSEDLSLGLSTALRWGQQEDRGGYGESKAEPETAQGKERRGRDQRDGTETGEMGAGPRAPRGHSLQRPPPKKASTVSSGSQG